MSINFLRHPGFIVEQQSRQRKRYSDLESPKMNVISCSNFLRVVRMLATLHLLWNLVWHRVNNFSKFSDKSGNLDTNSRLGLRARKVSVISNSTYSPHISTMGGAWHSGAVSTVVDDIVSILGKFSENGTYGFLCFSWFRHLIWSILRQFAGIHFSLKIHMCPFPKIIPHSVYTFSLTSFMLSLKYLLLYSICVIPWL